MMRGANEPSRDNAGKGDEDSTAGQAVEPDQLHTL